MTEGEVRRIAVLGATGSIGRSVQDLVRTFSDRFQAVVLAAHRDVNGILSWFEFARPRWVAMVDPAAAQALRTWLRGQGVTDVEVLEGPEGLEVVAALPEADTVVSAIVGAAGLKPTYAALQAGKRVCLANKESLVIAGPLMRRALQEGGGTLIPIDSEHSALFQAMVGESRSHIARLWLTASGGPFLWRPSETFETITVEEALHHPRWKMGPKVTIDSATLMNKGLEIVEAHYLFDWPADRIEVIIHPQSIVHSMVEFVDGTFKAQMSLPDMRLPIGYALAHPHRLPMALPTWRPVESGRLEFYPPEERRFPCLRLARAALSAGPSYPVVLNAANEVAVQAFLNRQIRFPQIAKLIEAVLEAHAGRPVTSLEDVWEIDRWARRTAEAWVGRYGEEGR
ncbi:MAG: 1-deoxy-D-xylulose-5-phosphate reductoisomerase [Acidobacteria bacterium]|nr:1-deoxy-D-xylulose-5-phosphate reductoisomerase [Acidobacteriota bacterium]MDW7983606.1 1-deoxy-D-xylulose-5-phosphate reductoisomerase [Acidobacteriota bacterium]